jgi:hypothetical protein
MLHSQAEMSHFQAEMAYFRLKVDDLSAKHCLPFGMIQIKIPLIYYNQICFWQRVYLEVFNR